MKLALAASILTLFAAPAPALAAVSDASVDAAVAKVRAMAADAVKNGQVPGVAIAIVHDDKLVWAGGFGLRDAAGSAPVDADTVFALASVSKPLASTVVAELVGEGKVRWDSKISDLDPAFQMPDPWVTREVRVDDLFAHRSGLPDHAGDVLEDLGADRAEVLHALRFQKGLGAFRASYAYTNFGLTEAAQAAARPYGLSWEDAAQSKLFKPLGMTSTSYRHADYLARADRAVGHVKVDGRWVVRFDRQPDAQAPAGGASSSANDMARWMRLELADGMFEGRPVVDAAALAETRAPQYRTGTNRSTGGPNFYGLGWNVGYDAENRLRLSHSGAFEQGAATSVMLVPAEKLGVIVLTNAAPVGVAEALGFVFTDQALHGRQTQDWMAVMTRYFADASAAGLTPGHDYRQAPVAPAPALANAAYVGTYANPYFGPARISEAGGRLTMTVGPRGMSFPLTHWSRDVFTYETVGENAIGPSGVSFAVGPDGRATGLVVENLNISGNGVFTREADAK